MWTRPDSFIYIGLFAGAVFLFNQPHVTGRDADGWFQLFLRATAVATLIYLPWFLFALAYYGSPVPHTIVAKSIMLGGVPSTVAGFWRFLRYSHHWGSPFEMLFMTTAPVIRSLSVSVSATISIEQWR